MKEPDKSAGSTQPLCPKCNQPLTWIPQYQRWYCYNDKEYFNQPQSAKKLDLGDKYKRIMIFGIILLAIGLFASFYTFKAINLTWVFPYQNIGILLDSAGMILVTLALLHPSLKDTSVAPSSP